MHKLFPHGLQTFGGHDYQIISSAQVLWLGQTGKIGLLNSDDELIEVDVNDKTLRPVKKIAKISLPQLDIWSTFLACSQQQHLYLAVSNCLRVSDILLGMQIFKFDVHGQNYEVIAKMVDAKVRSFAVCGNVVVFCVVDDRNRIDSYLLET